MKTRILSFILALTLLFSLCPAAGAAAGEVRYSDALVTFLKDGEGFRAMPYSGGSAWYIGYGCACNPADYPNGITEEGADALLRSKLDGFADGARRFLTKYGAEVTQQQFDAMCAMSYALGTVWLDAANRLPGYIIDGADKHTDAEIASAFAAWCHVGGAVSIPTLQRRITEAKIFLRGDYSRTADGFVWLTLDADGGENADSDVAVYPAGEVYGTLPEATRSGKYFVGWQRPDGGILSPSDIASENLALTALWSDAPVSAEEATEEPAEEPAEAPEEPQPPVESVFPDVPAGSWYAADVNALAAQGVVSGYPDGTFRPDGSVTWGEALKLILLAAGYPVQTPPEAKNGESVHWAQGYLDYAEKKAFLAKGAVGDLNRAVTRNEIADLCAAALELSASGAASAFADTSRASVLALYEAEILLGSFDGNGHRVYKGADNIRRCEICAILVRVTDYVARTLILFNSYRIPIDYTLRMSPYDADCFRLENGRLSYDDGTTHSRCGIDVSYYQGSIDWRAVAADGVEFAIIRCGYRGYTGGTINEDERFREYIEGATAAGLDVGVYFFSQAVNAAEALEEAAFTLSLIRGYRLRCPVVFDWEPITSGSSRTRSCDGGTVTACAAAFCDAVAAAGYTPMIYFNEQMAYTQLDLHRVQSYPGWLAWYHDYPDYVYDYQMWQYSSNGSVAGISARVDMNIAFSGEKTLF